MLGQILLTFVVVLVGVNLVPTVANTVNGITRLTNSTGGFGGTLSTPQNVSGVNATLLDLVPLFFVMAIFFAVASSVLEVLNKFNY